MDEVVDERTRRVGELERSFRRDGMPSLAVGRSPSRDVFPRAVPVLALAAAAEIVIGSDVATGWEAGLLAVVGAAALLGGAGLLNVLRGGRLVSLPPRVGVPELAAFVVVPAIPSVLYGEGPLSGFVTILMNVAIVAVVYVAVAFGLIGIVRWMGVHMRSLLRAGVQILIEAVPLLLFFSLVMFFTMEIWQVFTATSERRYWGAVTMFVVLGAVFLSASVPKVVDRIEADLSLDVPLRRRERLNLDAVVFVSAALQVVFVSAAVWLFYVALGALLVSLDVRVAWLGVQGRPLVDVSFLGEPVVVTYELVRVANGVAAFAGLYYAVTILGDAEKRERFADALSEQLRGTFARRSEYHELLARDDDGTQSGRGDEA